MSDPTEVLANLRSQRLRNRVGLWLVPVSQINQVANTAARLGIDAQVAGNFIVGQVHPVATGPPAARLQLPAVAAQVPGVQVEILPVRVAVMRLAVQGQKCAILIKAPVVTELQGAVRYIPGTGLERSEPAAGIGAELALPGAGVDARRPEVGL